MPVALAGSDHDEVPDAIPALENDQHAGDDVHEEALRGEGDEDADEGGAAERGGVAREEDGGYDDEDDDRGRVGDRGSDENDCSLTSAEPQKFPLLTWPPLLQPGAQTT